jgi:hypothetical protein
MRDLKADLEELESLKEDDVHFMSIVCFIENNAEKWLEQGVSEAERAEKAEALARELADMLGRVTPLEFDLELVHEAYGLLKKAKEVLGDE